MRIFKKAALIVGILSASLAANAVDIVIDGERISGDQVQSIVILPGSGDLVIQTKPTWELTIDQAPAGNGTDVYISSFSANTTSVAPRESFTLNWEVQNASTCTAFRGTSGWRATNINPTRGSRTLTVNVEAQFEFMLRCEDTAGNRDEAFVNVSISFAPAPEPEPEPQPEPEPEPTENCPTPSLSGSSRPWSTVFDADWPGPKSEYKLWGITKRGYTAISFDTGDVVDTGAFSTIESTKSAGARLGAISKCPGDFDVPEVCQHRWGISGGIIWSTENWPNSCPLEPNTRYYINVTFTDGVNASSDTCTKSSCFTEFRVNNP